jgi:uncharacterized membrane protein
MPSADTSSVGSERTELGVDENVEGALAYLFGLLSGVVLYVVEDNEFVRYHAAQSIIASLVATAALIAVEILASVVGLLAVASGGALGGALSLVFGLLSFGVTLVVISGWLFLMLRAFHGQRYRIPVVADLAESLV